jgi:hypothetical protein
MLRDSDFEELFFEICDLLRRLVLLRFALSLFFFSLRFGLCGFFPFKANFC